LEKWISQNSKNLCEILQPKIHVLFGEWCQLKHSIFYDGLPDYFIVFDLYDKVKGHFISRQNLETICANKFPIVPLITKQRFATRNEIEYLLNNTSSVYRIKEKGPLEGLYLKIDDENKGINIHRSKVVKKEFTQNITKHWMHDKTVFNIVRRFDNIA